MNTDSYTNAVSFNESDFDGWELLSNNFPVLNVVGNRDEVIPEKVKEYVEDDFDPTSFYNEIFRETSFKMVPCEKERGLTYLIKDKMVYTKKGVWVAIEVNHFKFGVLEIFERYSEKSCLKSPVVCDNKCEMETDGFNDLIENYSFLVKVKVSNKDFFFSPINDKGRHMVEINSRELFQESDIPPEKFVMYVKYRCRNTCETHKKNGKNRQLVIEHKYLDTSLPKGEWFEVRVCEAPKRDYHKDCNKRSSSSDECSNSPKKMKFKREEPEYDHIHTISEEGTIVLHESAIIPQAICGLTKEETRTGDGTEQTISMCSDIIPQTLEFQPTPIVAKMKSEDDEKMVIGLIRRLGGEFF